VIQRVRTVFKFAFDAEHIATPVRFGPGFKRPSKSTLRRERAKHGAKLFTPEEIRAMLDKAGVQHRAMILLGINAGYGNSDCAKLPLAVVDMDTGIIDYPRPKTGVPRRCVLWPETAQALRLAIAERPEPKDKEDAGLVFITKQGQRWGANSTSSPLSHEIKKIMDAIGANGHRNFYTLRHTFRTVADETKDQPAIDFVMGHESTHMSTQYREKISDDRLRAVTDYVRAWLFPALAKDDRQEAAEAEEQQHDDDTDGGPAVIAFPTARGA
jgi:integrase